MATDRIVIPTSTKSDFESDPNYISAMRNLREAKLDDSENINIMQQCSFFTYEVVDLLIELNKAKQLTPENRKCLLENISRDKATFSLQTYNMTQLLMELRIAGIPYNFTLVLQHAKYAFEINEGLSRLRTARWEGVTISEGDYELLIQQGKYATTFALALIELKKAGILTDNNRTFLIQHAQYADKLASGLSKLHSAGLLSDANRTLLAEHAQYADILASGLSELKKEGLLSDDNRTLLAQHAQYADEIASGMCQLHEIGFLSDDNRTLLIKHAPNAFRIGYGLAQLRRNWPLDTPENREFILTEDGAFAVGLARGLIQLKDAGLNNPADRALLINNAKVADEIASGLRELNQNSFPVTPTVYTILTQHAEFAWEIATALIALNRSRIPLSIENIRHIAEHPNHALFISRMVQQLRRGWIDSQRNYDTLIEYLSFLAERQSELYNLQGTLDQPKFNKIIEKIDKDIQIDEQHGVYSGASIQIKQKLGLFKQNPIIVSTVVPTVGMSGP